MLKNILMAVAAIYLLGAVLSGFTYLIMHQGQSSTSTLITTIVDRGVNWPVHLSRAAWRAVL